MGKLKNGKDFKPRSRGKDKKKNTFKKYGKNTSRGMRIKEADMAKQTANKKLKITLTNKQ
jgi:hypothetical protein|uniref:Uncharacterized protein n=1 Tax=viral metagenome TaxID=1070528 RepID=A0A6C0AKC4_9ZZZZ